MPQSPSQTFRITGLDCAEEVAVLKREVGPVVGGEDRLAFDILNGRMIVDAAPEGVSPRVIVDAVKRAGLGAEAVDGNLPIVEAPATFWQQRGRLVLTAVSGLALGAAMIAQHLAVRADIANMLFGIAIVAGVWLVLPKAWGAIRRLQPDMNLLMTVAVVGAVAIGEWFEAAAVAFLFSVSLLLESWSVGRARRAIGALMDLAPPTAWLVGSDGSTRQVSPQEVQVGATFLVKPGERIPLDGKVLDGTSDVNQAPITGESVPVPKTPGEGVFAGTINGDGAAANRIDSRGRRHHARPHHPPGRRRAVETRALGAVGRKICPRLHAHRDADRARDLPRAAAVIRRRVGDLVLPGAGAARDRLPVCIGDFDAGQHRRGHCLRRAAGRAGERRRVPRSAGPPSRDRVRQDRHTHRRPAARGRNRPVERTRRTRTGRTGRRDGATFRAPDRSRGARLRRDPPFRPRSGRRLSSASRQRRRAKFNGREFWLGSHRYLEERGQETPDIHQQLETMAGQGRTVVVVGNATHVCGLVALADEIRPGIAATLAELRAAGIEHLIMLTGDNLPTAEAVAAKAGVDEVRAELLPEDKVTAIEALVAKYDRVAMIGDGVNDAPALARATIGIAMGAAGTDAAIETADIALMADDLSKLPWLIRHSRRVLSVVRQNIVFSLAVKLAFVILTFAGISSLWGAIAADMGASLLVIANGLRLLR